MSVEGSKSAWRLYFGAMLTALVALISPAAQAAWPEKAIEIIVAYAPGGGTDLFARMVAQHMSGELGVPVNVVNIPGGNQLPGIKAVTSAAPDGYTLLLETSATSAIKAIMPDNPFDLEARTYGPLLAAQGGLIMVNGKSPWQNVGDMIAFINENPGQFTYVRLGGTSYSDLVTQALFSVAKVNPANIKPVDYTGNGPGNIAVAGGHVMMSAGSINPLIDSGDLKVLGIAGDQRAKGLPDVPTLAEAGYPVDFVTYFGLSGPSGLPDDVLAKLDEIALKVSQDPKFQEQLDSIGFYARFMPSAEVRPYVLDEAKKYKALSK
jgi:tripartite-type tricarboxylate transporter receptor subunit TctC